MKVSPDSWHWKLYCFMLQSNMSWHGKDDYHEYPRNTQMIGLCPYMRIILIWGPLSWLFQLFPIGAMIVVFFSFPGSANGAAGVGWLFLWIGVIIAVIFGLIKFKDWQDERSEANRTSKLDKYHPNYVEPEPGFIKMAWTWMHDKVCPILELPEESEK